MNPDEYRWTDSKSYVSALVSSTSKTKHESRHSNFKVGVEFSNYKLVFDI